ncbi:MAG: AAA family ATPase [Paracoccaceae bacterium]
MAPAPVHLVCGATGAGKTTYAIALAAREGAIRFSIDEWMVALFWADAPAELGDWAHVRVARCTERMRAVLAQSCALGVPGVVDAGFTTRADRRVFADWADGRGIPCRLHWLDAPAATRRRRVAARNAAGGGGTGFVVTEAMFDYMEALWEPPDREETDRLPTTRIAATGDATADG